MYSKRISPYSRQRIELLESSYSNLPINPLNDLERDLENTFLSYGVFDDSGNLGVTISVKKTSLDEFLSFDSLDLEQAKRLSSFEKRVREDLGDRDLWKITRFASKNITDIITAMNTLIGDFCYDIWKTDNKGDKSVSLCGKCRRKHMSFYRRRFGDALTDKAQLGEVNGIDSNVFYFSNALDNDRVYSMAFENRYKSA